MTSELAQNSDERAERIRELCRYMELHPDEPMRLRDLALRAGLSTFHLQRTFKSIVGVTPKDYLEARRVQLLKRNLRESRNVTDAVYDSGFGSSSRVYERADTRLGMTPQQYRDGGRDASISYVAAQTSIGVMMIGATDRGICFLQFGNDAGELAAALRREYPQAAVSPSKAPSHPQLQLWIESIRGYLAGERGRLDLPLDIRATAFQMRVWKYLQTIPVRLRRILRRSGRGHRTAVRGAGRGPCVCDEPGGHRHTVPPGGPRHRRARRLPLGHRTETDADRYRAFGRCEQCPIMDR